ncbi:unnamed protein product [Sphagnum compactum]
MHLQSGKQQIELVVTQENDFDKEAEKQSKSLLFFQGVHTLLTIAITLLTMYLCICFLSSVPRITAARYHTPANGSGPGEEEEKDSDFSHARLFARASSSLLGLISAGVVIVAGMWMSAVICDAYTPQGVPIPTNKRAAAAEVFAKKEVAEEVPWFGLEQEYTLLQKDIKWHLGWPKGGYSGPQVK